MARPDVRLETRGALLAVGLVGAALCACDLPPERARASGPQVASSSPAEGDREVPRLGPFVVRFDRRVLPWSVSRATVRLESGVISPRLSVRYDVLTQSAIAVPFDGAAIAELVEWRLVVEGVEDLDGRAMPGPYVAHFRTGEEPGSGLVTPPPATFADVEPILRARCTGAGCHGPGPAALGLDLSSARGVRETAINQPARSFPADTLGPSGGAGAPVFAALPLIEVIAGAGRPETSYLVYTVLADPHLAGAPMPPAMRDDPSAGLTADELRTLAAWISAGAPAP